jgi:hypothetical protein
LNSVGLLQRQSLDSGEEQRACQSVASPRDFAQPLADHAVGGFADSTERDRTEESATARQTELQTRGGASGDCKNYIAFDANPDCCPDLRSRLAAAAIIISVARGVLLRNFAWFGLLRRQWPFREKTTEWNEVQRIADGEPSA